MELKNTIKLLRFPFSIFLLPVSLFSLYYIQPEINFQLVLVLIIWHVLVFPSSNGYNGYHDRDEGPVGGLEKPPKPTRQLLHVANGMDAAAILLAFLINIYFVFFVTVYILASRLYSNRKVRLKKYPVPGFLVVFIFQGAWIFFGNIFALSTIDMLFSEPVIFSAIASSCLVGTVYPLTQIYQHKADQEDGVKTLSMLLGIKGTFLFSAGMFFAANILIFLSFLSNYGLSNFLLFNMVMLPSTLFFLIWAVRSFKDKTNVNFKNTMIMLVLSSLLNNLFFLILLLK